MYDILFSYTLSVLRMKEKFPMKEKIREPFRREDILKFISVNILLDVIISCSGKFLRKTILSPLKVEASSYSLD